MFYRVIRKVSLLAACTSFALLLSQCSTYQIVAQPRPGMDIAQDGKLAMTSKEGLAISVSPTRAPRGLGTKILAFRVNIINQTDEPIDFIPDEVVLFDQNSKQYFPLPKEALLEASMSSSRPRTYVSMGYSHYYSHGFYSFWHPIGHSPMYASGRSYQGIVGDALPQGPIRVFPHSRVEGEIYFQVSPQSLRLVDLQITRLSRPPQNNEDNPKRITYFYTFSLFR